jgi:hypothetical protein
MLRTPQVEEAETEIEEVLELEEILNPEPELIEEIIVDPAPVETVDPGTFSGFDVFMGVMIGFVIAGLLYYALVGKK